MNITVVCPHCIKVNRIPQKESYNKANCGHCKKSLLDSSPIEVNGDKLDFFLANSGIPLVVDFWAPWCGPCRQMTPAFKEVALVMPLEAQFLKVNTEDESALGSRYSVQSIPTLIIFTDAKEKTRVTGALSAGRLQSWIRQSV